MAEQDMMDAVNKYYTDRSRSAADTIAGLERLQEELEMMIDGLKMTAEADEDF